MPFYIFEIIIISLWTLSYLYTKYYISALEIRPADKYCNRAILYQRIPLAICMVFLAMMVMFRRYDIGKDTINYLYAHENIIPFDFTHRFEKGYLLVSNTIKFIFETQQWLLIICGAINYTLYYWFIKKYSNGIFLSIICMITLGFFDASMNIMRQAIATAIVACSYNYIIKRKLLMFSMTLLIASSFHITSIFFYPAYFIYKLEFNLKTITIITTITIILGIGFNIIITKLLGGIEIVDFYSNSIYGEGGRMGALFQSSIYIIIIANSLIIKRIIGNRKFTLLGLSHLSNIVLCGMYLTLLSFNMSIIGRIASYYTVFAIILMPNLINSLSYQNKTIFSLFSFSILNLYYYIIVFYRPEWSATFPYYTFLN